jgi:hypothetical protein
MNWAIRADILSLSFRTRAGVRWLHLATKQNRHCLKRERNCKGYIQQGVAHQLGPVANSQVNARQGPVQARLARSNGRKQYANICSPGAGPTRFLGHLSCSTRNAAASVLTAGYEHNHEERP